VPLELAPLELAPLELPPELPPLELPPLELPPELPPLELPPGVWSLSPPPHARPTAILRATTLADPTNVLVHMMSLLTVFGGPSACCLHLFDPTGIYEKTAGGSM